VTGNLDDEVRGEFPHRDLIALYETHPCNAVNLIARLEASGRERPALTAMDLARDPIDEITDQNHVGGATFVLELAEAAHITGADRVLDLGCGLGGSARLLAASKGCAVDGVDISPRRVEEGNYLTRLVGLTHLVSLRCDDIRTGPVPQPVYDCLWGQASWVHVRQKRIYLRRWLRGLKGSGRIAMEDAYVKTSRPSPAEARLLARLSDIWMASVPTLEEWEEVLSRPGTVSRRQDLTQGFQSYYRRLIELAAPGPGPKAELRELEGWRLAVTLAEHDVLGYVRIVTEIADPASTQHPSP
jgi:SAM-dependent methyltransferase